MVWQRTFELGVCSMGDDEVINITALTSTATAGKIPQPTSNSRHIDSTWTTIHVMWVGRYIKR